ncbi:MAG TPA: DUF1883 domain-containing protein [Solirubrobacteraceae bacterium]|nr:DUF1883 domain-containing protein [Solirubrobacteraceae bacterium]
MRFSYHDLGHQPAGSTVVVHLTGSAANVLLVDPTNFGRYRARQAFSYHGGLCKRSPAEIEIPSEGHWLVIIDLGGYKGRVRGRVEVVAPDGRRTEAAAERDLVEA